MTEQVKVDIIVKALISGFDEGKYKFDQLAATQNKLALAIDNASSSMARLAAAEKNLSANTDPAKQGQLRTEVLRAQTALDSELKTIDNLNKELDKLQKSSDDAGKSQKKLGDAAGDVEPKTRKQNSSLGALTGTIGQVAAAAGIFIGVFKEAFDMAEAGAQIQLAEERLGRLAGKIGTTSEALMEKLRPAVGGMASDAELVAQAGQVIELGLAKTEDEAVRLTTVVSKLGLDMSQVILTFANDSTMRLDALGLSVEDVTARTKKYTDAGIEASKAFDMAVLDALEGRLELVGDATDSTAGTFERARVKIDNLTDSIKKSLAAGLGPWVAMVTGQYHDAIRQIERDNLAAAEAADDYTLALHRSYQAEQDIIVSAARSSETLQEFTEKLQDAKIHTFDEATTASWYAVERAIFITAQTTQVFNETLAETVARREQVRATLAKQAEAEAAVQQASERAAEQQARAAEEQMGRLGTQVDLWSRIEENIVVGQQQLAAFERAMDSAVGMEQQKRLIDLALYWGTITEEEAAARHELLRLEEVQNRIYNTALALTSGVQVYYDLADAASTYRQQLEQIEGLNIPTPPSPPTGGGSTGTGPGAGDLIAPPGGGYIPPTPPPPPATGGSGQRYQGAVTSAGIGSTYNIWLDNALLASVTGTLTAGVVAEQMGVNG